RSCQAWGLGVGARKVTSSTTCSSPSVGLVLDQLHDDRDPILALAVGQIAGVACPGDLVEDVLDRFGLDVVLGHVLVAARGLWMLALCFTELVATSADDAVDHANLAKMNFVVPAVELLLPVWGARARVDDDLRLLHVPPNVSGASFTRRCGQGLSQSAECSSAYAIWSRERVVAEPNELHVDSEPV